MSTPKKILLATALLILVAVFLGVAFIFGDHAERRELISRSEATNFISFPLVDSATNIYCYFDAGGLQHLEAYTRFTVANSDITNQINLAIADNNHRFDRHLRYGKKDIDSSEIMPGPSPHAWSKTLLWWAPEKITNGFYIGENESYAYQIWVDKSTRTLFIYQSD